MPTTSTIATMPMIVARLTARWSITRWIADWVRLGRWAGGGEGAWEPGGGGCRGRGGGRGGGGGAPPGAARADWLAWRPGGGPVRPGDGLLGRGRGRCGHG